MSGVHVFANSVYGQRKGNMGMKRRKDFPSQEYHGTVMPLSRSSVRQAIQQSII
jgi:hypothetical protein